LSPGGSTHLHTNNTQNNTNNNRTTQITNNVEECGPCPVFASFYPGICLTTEEKARKFRRYVIATLLVVVGPFRPTTTNRAAITKLRRQTRGCYCSCCSSWWWAWGCPKHVERYLNDKKLRWEIAASGWLIQLKVWWCPDLQTLNLRKNSTCFGQIFCPLSGV
jgi:hypothetical protein